MVSPLECTHATSACLAGSELGLLAFESAVLLAMALPSRVRSFGRSLRTLGAADHFCGDT
jgi:hypothetical protein